MTEAEKKLLDAFIARESDLFALDPDHYNPLSELTQAVLQERTPPEFESTLANLALRFVEAQEAFWEYAKRAPLGRKMGSELLAKARAAKGINVY